MSTLKVRMRPDLILAAHGHHAARYWVVQDPVTLKYFRLRDEECSILRMLDGSRTLEEIRQHFERQFAPLRLGATQLQSFLFRLHEYGLILGDVPGQGAVLSQRNQTQRQKTLLAGIANPLAIRLPGLAARPIVEWLYPRLRWLFSPPILFLSAALVIAALSLVIAEFATFQARLPSFDEFFSTRSAALFVVVLIAVKALHELAHALVCRHFGGSCREFGMLLLVFMPTLYCDVSDAWRLDSRWQRILISAAGMLVELVLASIATLLWWFSEPGLLHAICLRVMFLCSVSTLLFNANPLVRCDGYYILSDLTDVPNLWQESRWQWRRLFWSWLTARELPDDPTVPRRIAPWLMLYAALSTIYCWLLIGGILWFCFRVLEPHGLLPAAWLLAAIVAAGLLAAPLRSMAQTISAPLRRREIRPGRAATALVLITALVAASLFVPLPHRIAAPLWIEAAGAQPLYVTAPGRLIEVLPAGAAVSKGQTIGNLISPEVELQVAELTAEVKRKALHLKNLRLILADDPSVAPLIPAEEKSLADAQDRLSQWRRDQDRLILKSPADGAVLPPPFMANPDAEPKRLAAWRGTPLDAYNRGCYLETGSLVCLVGDPKSLEAILVIEQSAIPFVTEGQTVRLRIDQGPVITVTGKITELAKTDAQDIPAPLAQALDLPLAKLRSAGARPAETYYQARVKLDPHAAPLLIGMHGHAKIIAPAQPLGPRLLRYLQRTFRV